MRKMIVAAFAASLFATGAAMAQMKPDQNDNAYMDYFEKNQMANAPMINEDYAVGAAVPSSVQVYEFRDRPEWRDYRYAMSGTRYYVIDGNRQVVRSIERRKGK